MIKKLNIYYRVIEGSDRQKLKAVKLLKSFTGWGLKEAKTEIDYLYDHPGVTRSFEINVNPQEFRSLIKDYCPPELVVNSLEDERNIKLLALGLGEDTDYQDCLEYYLGFQSNSLMKEVVSILTKEQRIHLIEKIKEEFYG